MEIQVMLLTPNQYSRPGTKLSKVTKIAIHYVGNPGSSAKANRNYFESLKDKKTTYASSHYIIGLDGEIIQCVPESEIAYCTNEANSYSISIENCHPYADGKFTEKTYQSLLELCSDLCKRYKLNAINDIIRHFDVTGKKCPLYFVNNPNAWEKFKQDVHNFNNDEEKNEMLTTMKVKIDDGDVKTVQSILREGQNYPNLRELAAVMDYSVSYDAASKVVYLKEN